MSLKQCSECGNTVSDKAKTCPHCGAKVRKSAWWVVGFIVLAIICAYVIVLLPIRRYSAVPEQRKSTSEQKELATEQRKTDVENTVRESLSKEYGIKCTSVDLIEGSQDHSIGIAKLEDGREFDIDARIEGDMVSFTRQVKQGYEYKCKHHIDQIRLIVLQDVKPWCVKGKVWNDGIEPVRGFVVAEFIDESGKIYYRFRSPFLPSFSEELNLNSYFLLNKSWSSPSDKVFPWIPPGKSSEFTCISYEPLTEKKVKVRVEFFNLADEPLASIDYRLFEFERDILDSVNVKVTAEAHQVQEEFITRDEWIQKLKEAGIKL
jgi:hypothetical protein